VAVTKGKVDVLVTDVDVGVVGAHVDDIFHVDQCFRRSLVMRINSLQVAQICLEDVIHFDAPKLFVTELLPRFKLKVRQDALSYQLFSCFRIGLDNLRLKVLDVCKSHKNF